MFAKKSEQKLFHGVFIARGDGPKNGVCYKLDINKIVPKPGKEIKITVSQSDMHPKVATVPIFHDVRISEAHNPAESDYTNNRESTFDSDLDCYLR